ncbi:MAG: nuclear transport factor 2 family protein [Thalassotalea sp.]
MNVATQQLEQVLKIYFDGLYWGDIRRLKNVFHPKAQYSCATNGELIHMEMEQYFSLVATRISPAEAKHQRSDKIISLDFAGNNTALAKVQCSIQAKAFIDYLSFIFIDNQWQIIAKVFHYDLITNQE